VSCLHGEAAVGGVRLGLECNDQNAGSEGAPSRASTRMSARIIEGGGEHGGRPHDAPRYFHRRTIQGPYRSRARIRELLISRKGEAGALAVLDEPLRDDIGHELVSVVDALAAHS
jgi:hypothetical protein